MRNEMIKIGQLIKTRRELLGLLQPQLSSIAAISTRTIQLIEMGKANPSLETLFRITSALGLEIKVGLKDIMIKDGDQ